jgi:hypothetical protein
MHQNDMFLHATEEVDRIIHDILSKLPKRTDADRTDAVASEQEYRRAVIELEEEQHEFLGVLDLFKSFWQWFESPEERVLRNRSLGVNEVGTQTTPAKQL